MGPCPLKSKGFKVPLGIELDHVLLGATVIIDIENDTFTMQKQLKIGHMYSPFQKNSSFWHFPL